jgi:glycosyltransferase involved in cell wall biosynthesis
MSISVVIPTCNRRARLLSTLGSLDRSSQAFFEVIIVDSGEEKLSREELAAFSNLAIVVVDSEQSVCIQRNIGIGMARSPLIFLCDDDVEVPAHYVRNLSHHMDCHPEAGAVSGLFLQKEGDDWTAVYPLRSSKMLLWNYIFRLSIWGPIEVSNPSQGQPYHCRRLAGADRLFGSVFCDPVVFAGSQSRQKGLVAGVALR